MGQITLQTPVVGEANATAAPKIASDFTTLQTVINGNLDSTNLSSTLLASAGVGSSYKGSSIIATSEVISNTSYTKAPTPDQVANLVVPSGGLVEINYQATWQESVAGAARAAIFIGANQLKSITTGLSPFNPVLSTAQGETSVGANNPSANTPMPLASYAFGLASAGGGSAAYPGDATTGQAMGLAGGATFNGGQSLPVASSVCKIFVAAGTYTVSVQFKASSGTVTVSNRRLYAQVVNYA